MEIGIIVTSFALAQSGLTAPTWPQTTTRRGITTIESAAGTGAVSKVNGVALGAASINVRRLTRRRTTAERRVGVGESADQTKRAYIKIEGVQDKSQADGGQKGKDKDERGKKGFRLDDLTQFVSSKLCRLKGSNSVCSKAGY